jgi:flagellin
MPLIINTNIQSLQAQRALSMNTNNLQKSMERLSSGFRINKASDDAAGLQISESLRAQIRGSQKAVNNAQDGISVLDIADGALGQMTELLQRMRELTVEAANDTNGTAQRNAITSELYQLSIEITRIGDSIQFNGRNLLDGSLSTASSYKIQVGPNGNVAQNTIDIVSVFGNIDAASLNVDTNQIYIDTNANAITALNNIDTALQSVTNRRGQVGAYVNRLEFAIQTLMINVENYSSAESRIRNVDVAAESAKLTQNQILQQASVSILSQANQAPQLALSLLQGR